MISANDALNVVLFLAILIPSIILHEIAHGWVAERFGDPTAREAGRLTLNPIPHIDPVGSLLFPGLMALTGGPIFGWAKPVPVHAGRLRRPTRDMALVALAGPATNLVLAAVVAFAARWDLESMPGRCTEFVVYSDAVCLGGGHVVWTSGLPARIALTFVLVNILLAIFNMLPIPPLDGSRLLPLVLPDKAKEAYYRISQYGFLILIALIFVFEDALGFIWDWAGWVARLMI